jgi:hypothetical protein
MHFRVLDLAAERSVWSVPPIDMVPQKLRKVMVAVRAFDTDANLLETELVDGSELESAIERLFADQRATYLHICLATDGSYAGHVERFDVQIDREFDPGRGDRARGHDDSA